MRHLLRSAAIAAAFVASSFALAATADAATISIDRDLTNYSSANGGEFSVLTFGGSVPAMGAGVQVSGGLFQTFCLEADAHIRSNTSYDYTLGTGATNGGVSGGNPDPIDARTAYLFTSFWRGTLSSYNYTLGSGRVASATSLQLAIWLFEGEIPSGSALETQYNADSQAQAWVSEANTAVASGGSWFGQGIGDVRVINPTTSTGGDVQSMLVLVPVPPAFLLGLGLLAGLGGVGLLRRRRRLALV